MKEKAVTIELLLLTAHMNTHDTDMFQQLTYFNMFQHHGHGCAPQKKITWIVLPFDNRTRVQSQVDQTLTNQSLVHVSDQCTILDALDITTSSFLKRHRLCTAKKTYSEISALERSNGTETENSLVLPVISWRGPSFHSQWVQALPFQDAVPTAVLTRAWQVPMQERLSCPTTCQEMSLSWFHWVTWVSKHSNNSLWAKFSQVGFGVRDELKYSHLLAGSLGVASYFFSWFNLTVTKAARAPASLLHGCFRRRKEKKIGWRPKSSCQYPWQSKRPVNKPPVTQRYHLRVVLVPAIYIAHI